MKFAKEIEDDLVPEWRLKYFNYKQGKKKIKALQRAIQNAHKSPRTPLRRALTPKTTVQDLLQGSPSRLNRTAKIGGYDPTQEDAEAQVRHANPFQSHSAGISSATRSIPVPQPAQEQYSLTADQQREQRLSGSGDLWTRYGSITASPPSPPPLSRAATLNLPDPAMDPASDEDSSSPRTESHQSNRPIVGSAPTYSQSPFEAGKTRHPSRIRRSLATRHLSLMPPTRTNTFNRSADRPLLKSIFSSRLRSRRKAAEYTDVPMEALKEIEVKQNEFFSFLDTEMEKIEAFYKEKEEEATHRLKLIKEQLHEMRDQRGEEIEAAQKAQAHKKTRKHTEDDDEDDKSPDGKRFRSIPAHIRNMPHSIDAIYHPIQAAKQVHFGKDPKPNTLATPPIGAFDGPFSSLRDYTRRPHFNEITYIQAKRRLKSALQEYYRGLELLKSYALLNRTAFRKINKKYDKGVNARPTMRYMTERVNEAYFVKSTVVDEHITATEDLYARYFEKGSHKIAVAKLRKKTRRADSYLASVFRNGLSAAAGVVFAIEGLVLAAKLSDSKDAILATTTNYLLQIYGAYFLLVFLVLFFCFDCRIFSRAKVNYAFVFEFDTRHNLDWRQLSELPCFFLFLMGLTMWLNFNRIGGETMYIWWPVLLICLTVFMIFLPLPILYHESRKWFIYSCWRLLGAGLYPVEFRDFFLGDMFCSETYSFGGIELFFCVYANSWVNPEQCNSSSSKLLGFLTTLPGIMRLLQCLRRYYDTRNTFPHLVNAGKYSFTILQYASLSAVRISSTTEMRAFFITCATINGVYCSIWDLLMDWSLMDPYAHYPLLRPTLAYKPHFYYAAMIIDPILRFNWIFYAIPIFSDEIQHSALLGFLVSFSEVIRRGIWTLFRVENEHCTNVGRFRASRDLDLPYILPTVVGSPRRSAPRPYDGPKSQESLPDSNALEPTTSHRSGVNTAVDVQPALATGADLERAGTRDTATSSLRRRQQQQNGSRTPLTPSSQSIRARVGTLLRGAHAQDFERRRKDVEEHEAPASDDDDSERDAAVSDEEDEDDMKDEIAGRVPGGGNTATPMSSARLRGDDGGLNGSRNDAESAHAQSWRAGEGDGAGDGDDETSRQDQLDFSDAVN